MNLGDIEKIELELPAIIKRIAEEHRIPEFITNPDFLEKRLEKWHQFGLLNHTKEVRKAFLNELNPFLIRLGIYENVKKIMLEEVEGIKKNMLLELSITLHDLGKIIVFGSEKTNREHEIASKSLIYEDFLKQKLISLGLTENQIDYIARCIETHDVIGKEIRDVLKHSKNLNLSYLSKQEAIILCSNLAEKYPDVKIEIGIFFLCDSLGKTDVRIKADSDNEILQKEEQILKILEKRNLPLELRHAVMQLPVNIKIAEVYLKNLISSFSI